MTSSVCKEIETFFRFLLRCFCLCCRCRPKNDTTLSTLRLLMINIHVLDVINNDLVFYIH